MRFVISIWVLLTSTVVFGQLEGDQWVIGYYSNGHNDFSVMFLDFRSGNLSIQLNREIQYFHSETAASICDFKGNPIIITNGMSILDGDGRIIEDTISYDNEFLGYWDYFTPYGFPLADGALILPVPNNDNMYSILYHSCGFHPDGYFQVNKQYEARVLLGPEGFDLLFRDSVIGDIHSWYTYPQEAVRHGNGRDWWIVSFEEESSKYYTRLLDPSGLRAYYEGEVDSLVKTGLGQAVFSGLGSYLARMDATTLNEGQFITLYKFDRCNGILERIESMHTVGGLFSGIAFSPSERYLYADNNTHLWQWDLWADDISASQTLVDTFDGFIQPGWFAMKFGPMMQTPDGRIYIVPPAGGSRFLHVIERPDLPVGQNRFKQHHIELNAWNSRTAPNIPNFKLGPLDHSPCDTLGLDNHPVSWWRYEEDQPGWWQTIRFTDLSYFDPDTWHWDFDDGYTSSEQHPIHTFDPGIYHVCLTVSNEYSTDSMCRWVEILTTAIDANDIDTDHDLSIAPNPFTESLRITSKSGILRNTRLKLYDMHGRLIMNESNLPVPINIHMPSLLPGMYQCIIEDNDGTVMSEKVMKM